MKKLKSLTILRRHDLIGLAFGWLAFWASLRPSLLPREWYLQIVISAVTISISYGLGAAVSRLIAGPVQKYKDRFYRKPSAKTKRLIYVAGFALVTYQLIESSLWQYETYELIGQPAPDLLWLYATVGVGIGSLILSQALIALGVKIGHGVRWIYRKALNSAPIQRLPEGIFQSLVTLAVIVVVALILNGVITRAFGTLVYNIYDARNQRETPAPYLQPESPLLSGSKESLIPWDKLGYQGRKFVAGHPTVEDIERITDKPAIQPVRVYAAYQMTHDPKAQAELAVKEMVRTKAFERKAIQIVVTTGTGWVSPKDTRPLEYVLSGDVATVAIQYSFLPSWISFMVDQQQAKQAGYQLVSQIVSHVNDMPAAERPELYLFGESLGSYGAEYVYASHPELAGDITGAFFVGAPGINIQHQKLTRERQPSSPSYRPVYGNGQDVVFVTGQDDVDDIKQRPKVIYLQNPTDPVVKMNADLLWSKPDWVEEEKLDGYIAERFTWRPVVTFFQVAMDSVFALSVPIGYGHHYGDVSVNAWMQLTGTELTDQQVEAIKRVI